MKLIITTLILFITSLSFGQTSEKTNLKEVAPEKEYDNILVKNLYSDAKASYFVIWIKKEVKSHKHLKHTESIIVLDGEGEMTVGKKKFDIKQGDHFTIPENTFHSVIVTSKNPLKVVSVQAPEFHGKDRIFEDKSVTEY
jgi:mannose-6-phosphate isomerase-like protein (cupin superfamily)